MPDTDVIGEPELPAEVTLLLSSLLALEMQSRRFWANAAAVEGMNGSDLLALSRLVDEGGMTGLRLRSLLGLSSGSVSDLFDRLESRGAVERSRSGPDRRQVQIVPTPRGRQIVARTMAPLAREMSRLLQSWGDGGSRLGILALDDVRSALAGGLVA